MKEDFQVISEGEETSRSRRGGGGRDASGIKGLDQDGFSSEEKDSNSCRRGEVEAKYTFQTETLYHQ